MIQRDASTPLAKLLRSYFIQHLKLVSPPARLGPTSTGITGARALPSIGADPQLDLDFSLVLSHSPAVS